MNRKSLRVRRRGGRGRPPDSRQDAGATFFAAALCRGFILGVGYWLRTLMRMPAAIDLQLRGARLTTIFPLYAASALAALLSLAMFAGCDVERRRSDAELGLNPQQSAGRKLYDDHCDRCHRPYSTKGRKGPGLKGVFQHQYLPLSGLPANDERVSDIIRSGRHEMPAYGQILSPQDLQDLLAYLHTL